MDGKKQGGNVVVGILIIGLIIWGVTSLFSDDDSSDYTPSSYSDYSGNSDYYSDEEEYEPENPYSEGSGHSAGYEWAMENEPSSCGGNSQSFIEGCEEYMYQLEYGEEDY